MYIYTCTFICTCIYIVCILYSSLTRSLYTTIHCSSLSLGDGGSGSSCGGRESCGRDSTHSKRCVIATHMYMFMYIHRQYIVYNYRYPQNVYTQSSSLTVHCTLYTDEDRIYSTGNQYFPPTIHSPTKGNQSWK